MPEIMPEHFRRGKYENFCINCAQCAACGPPCYIRWLAHGVTPTEVKEATSCAYCGECIPKGTRTTIQEFYAWPAPLTGSEDERVTADRGGVFSRVRTPGLGIPGADVVKRVQTGAWHNLNHETQRRFQRAGLGRGLGTRTAAQAQQFYQTSVPVAVQNQGEKAILKFIKGKDASHVCSVSKMPDMAKTSDNVVWESIKKNRARRGSNMTSTELAAVKSVNRRAAFGAAAKGATKGGVVADAKGAAKGGVVAAAMEAPVSGLENFFHWRRGRKSGRQAAGDAAKNTAGAGAVGVGTTVAVAGVAKGAALVGIPPALGPAGPVLAGAGIVLMGGTVAYRLIKAAKWDLPLDEYRLFFCKDTDCKTKFAWDVTSGAPRKDRRRPTWLVALALASLTVAVIAIGTSFF